MRPQTPPLIAGNWKMHLTRAEAGALVQAVVQSAPELAPAKFVLLPPYTALAEAAARMAGSAVSMGGQNFYWEDKGAFTGEVSAPLLADAGCRYVLVGHSERRHLFGETDQAVNKKILASLRVGLRPIVCVGETLEEREAGRTFDVIRLQLEVGLSGLNGTQFASLVLAYEPVWAIGTGKTASPAEAQEAHAFIRTRLEEKYGKPASDCAIILYGGSVKPANAYYLFKERDIDGFLVGGASLEAASFLGIAGEAVKAYKEVQ